MSMNEVVKKLSQAIDKQADKAKTTAYDTPATVRRIEGDTAWVHIPGGVDETPVKLTISAKEGDQVQVRVSGGSAFMVGNGTNPPTDDTRANSAYSLAAIAEGAAQNALGNATLAKEAADSAQASASAAESAAGDAVIAAGNAQTAAGNAQQSADSALVNLSTVQDVVGVLNWITAHGTMTLTSDVTVNPAHVYFIVDAGGDYVVGGTHYSIVSEPKDAELSTYYELTVDESVQNYVATHIVVDSEGLWIVPDAGGNKVLIATGAGSTYTTAGTYIVGKVGGVDTVLAAFTSSGAQIGKNNEPRAIIDSDSFVFSNDLGYSTFSVDALPTASYANKGLWAQYNNESPFEVPFPWHCTSINNNIQCFTASKTYITGLNPPATLTDNKAVFSAATCSTLQSNSVKYILIGYTANGAFPYFTLGERSGSESTCGMFSACIGEECIASGESSVALNGSSEARGDYSHAENSSTATGKYSHSEGFSSVASGLQSHAEGHLSESSGGFSHSQNYGTVANRKSQTTIGEYNIIDSAGGGSNERGDYALIIGNGTAENARSNALTVDWNGNVEAAGGADLAAITESSGTYSDGLNDEALLTTATITKWQTILGI